VKTALVMGCFRTLNEEAGSVALFQYGSFRGRLNGSVFQNEKTGTERGGPLAGEGSDGLQKGSHASGKGFSLKKLKSLMGRAR